MASSDSQKPQHGCPKRAELPNVNINTGVQSINTESYFKYRISRTYGMNESSTFKQILYNRVILKFTNVLSYMSHVYMNVQAKTVTCAKDSGCKCPSILCDRQEERDSMTKICTGICLGFFLTKQFS